MTLPTIAPPALRQALKDPTLSKDEKLALTLLWQDLSPLDYRPYKAEALGHQLRIKRESAARILRRLIELGYLVAYQPDPRGPRHYLLVNVVVSARAA